MRSPVGSGSFSLVAVVLGNLLLSTACKHEPPPSVAPAPSAAPVPAVAIDHLAPGELMEGTDSAFGLLFPRGTSIDGRFVGVVYASHPANIHSLESYFATRLREVRADWHPRGVSLEKVKLPSQPGVTLSLLIEQKQDGPGSRITIYDATEHPAPAFATEEERWRAAGFTKDGKIADPIHYN